MTSKQRFAALLGAMLCTTAVLPSLPASAEEADVFYTEEGEEIETYTCGDYTYSLMTGAEDETLMAACIESYSGSDSDVIIPSELDGYEVVALGDRAFMENYSAISITLPATVIGLGKYSFYACTGVKSYYVEEGNPYYYAEDGILWADDGGYLVQYPIGNLPVTYTVPDGVYEIGSSAFADCRSLTEITFPDTLEFLGYWAFAECGELTEVTLPDTVLSIDDFAFASCTKLTKINMSDNVTEICAGAFSYCESLTEFTIPSACVAIGQAAFAASGLTEITIPSTVTEIGYSAFGWEINAEGDLVAQTDFVIYGIAGSQAQVYACDTENGNDFAFEEVDASVFTTAVSGNGNLQVTQITTAMTEEATKSFSTLSIVLLSLIGVAILILIGLGVAFAVSKKHTVEDTPNPGNDTALPENETEPTGESENQEQE